MSLHLKPNVPEQQTLMKRLFDLREQWQLAMKIAWRNIIRHKGKSIIIGLILLIGALLLTSGISVLSGMNKGLEKNLIGGFTGDLILIATNQKYESVIAGGGMNAVKPFDGYTNIRRIMMEEKTVEGLMPICRGLAMVMNEDGESGFTGILGIEFDKYLEFFNTNIYAIEGAIPAKGEKAALVSAGGREENYRHTAMWFVPVGVNLVESNLLPEIKSNMAGLNTQSNVVLMGLSEGSTATDIRLPIKGVFRYKNLDSFWKDYSLMDLESFRECFGWKTGDQAAVVISQDKQKLLDMETENLDDMFGSTDLFGSSGGESSLNLKELVKKDIKTNNQTDPELGTYNIVLVKLKNGVNMEKEVIRINEVLKKANAPVKAITWKKATTSIGDFANLLAVFLVVVVCFIYFVAIVIIMNTLSMAAIERTNEIGMMRAVGAGRGFIGQMFFSEIIILSGIAGGIGIFTGLVATLLFDLLKLRGPSNEMVSMLFGGDYFYPQMDIGSIVLVIGLQILVTLIAMIYPVMVASKITPLEAISRD